MRQHQTVDAKGDGHLYQQGTNNDRKQISYNSKQRSNDRPERSASHGDICCAVRAAIATGGPLSTNKLCAYGHRTP